MSVASILSGTPAVLNPDLGSGTLLTGVQTIPIGQNGFVIDVPGVTQSSIILFTFKGGVVDANLAYGAIEGYSEPGFNQIVFNGNQPANLPLQVMWYVAKL